MELGKFAENTIISDIDSFRKKLEKIKQGGYKKLHLVSDFDWTITKRFDDESDNTSSFGMIKRYGGLGYEYEREEKKLHQLYFPYEISANVTEKERFNMMKEWWTLYVSLFERYKLSKDKVDAIIASYALKFRSGFSDLVDMLEKSKIPLLVFSSGLGTFVKGFLEKNGLLRPNMDIVANFFDYDEDGHIKGYKDGIIHIANKKESFTPEKFKKDIEGRDNVILLGDSIMDATMVEENDEKNVLRIGYLNENVKARLAEYRKKYDVIIVKDAGMEFVCDLVKEIKE